MKGVMYIAGSFEAVDKGKCGRGKGWIDNDPHFWTSPPTWGICRNDLRLKIDVGNYVFFVLPKKSKHPQTIFGYLQVRDIVTHDDAFNHIELRSKRMGNKNPNGNIIVDELGHYNRFDGGAHKGIFEKVRGRYVVGNAVGSRFLTGSEIQALAPDFVKVLRRILGKQGRRPIDLISRYGCELSGSQVDEFLKWVNESADEHQAKA